MELIYIDKNGSVKSREMLPEEEKRIPSKTKPGGVLWSFFKHHDTYLVEGNRFKVSDLLGLSKVFGCEFAAYERRRQLYIKKGNEYVPGQGIASNVILPVDARVLMHVHPVFKSYAYNFEEDFKAIPNNVTEAVVDYSFNIILFHKNIDNGRVIFNPKNNDYSLQHINYTNQNWPDFLTKNPNQNVEIKV